MRIVIIPILLSTTLILATDVSAISCGPQRTSSGAVTIGVAELYTSEGCDSCPPADKWFSSLNVKKDGVVPLVFHVDYWDYIGWKDRFANTIFTERQRESVKRQGGRTSYTPQVIVNGQDLRPWSDQSRFGASSKSLAARTPRANLALDLSAPGSVLDVVVTASVTQIPDRADTALFLAITESNLSSRVTAGENRGATLKHDHVVRALYGPLGDEAKDRTSGMWEIKRPIPLGQDWKRKDLSLVAFVQNLRTGEIYQAVSAPLCAVL